MGIGAALLAATRWNDAPFATLAGAAAGAILHVVSHIVDDDRGGNDSDIPVFGVMAVLLVAGAIARWRAAGLRA